MSALRGLLHQHSIWSSQGYIPVIYFFNQQFWFYVETEAKKEMKEQLVFHA